MLTMQRFQMEGIRTYDQATKNLKSHNIAPEFDTPKHHVTVSDAGSADCAILVIPADAPASGEGFKHLFSVAEELIIVINKMDGIDWSEESFKKAVERLELDTENIPVIPVSASNGDNVVEKSSKGSWYRGWTKRDQRGVTLLEALETSFQR